MRATLKDVAKFAGVSTATVSMVINKKASHISQKTKDNVMTAIEKLEYKPNYTARSLVSAQSFTIGLIVPDITNPFFAQLAKELEVGLNKAGYIAFLCNSGEDSERESRYIEELVARSVDGLLICGFSKGNEAKLQNLLGDEIPYLLLDNRIAQTKSAIKVDDFVGGEIVAEHLLELNHSVVAFVGSEADYTNIWNRYKGFSKKMIEEGKQVILFETDLTKEGGQKVASAVFSSDATAVFCGNDMIAVGIYEQARKEGVRLPEELSIVGFDDITFAEILVPKLTTVKQPLEQIADRAVDRLMQMMTSKNYEFESETLPVELIVRESTCTNE